MDHGCVFHEAYKGTHTIEAAHVTAVEHIIKGVLAQIDIILLPYVLCHPTKSTLSIITARSCSTSLLHGVGRVGARNPKHQLSCTRKVNCKRASARCPVLIVAMGLLYDLCTPLAVYMSALCYMRPHELCDH